MRQHQFHTFDQSLMIIRYIVKIALPLYFSLPQTKLLTTRAKLASAKIDCDMSLVCHICNKMGNLFVVLSVLGLKGEGAQIFIATYMYMCNCGINELSAIHHFSHGVFAAIVRR